MKCPNRPIHRDNTGVVARVWGREVTAGGGGVSFGRMKRSLWEELNGNSDRMAVNILKPTDWYTLQK